MKVKPGKSYLLLSTQEEKDITVLGKNIKNKASGKLSGIIIDSKISFNIFNI